jgi:hypothetical protein
MKAVFTSSSTQPLLMECSDRMRRTFSRSRMAASIPTRILAPVGRSWGQTSSEHRALKFAVKAFGKILILRGVADEARVIFDGLADHRKQIVNQLIRYRAPDIRRVYIPKPGKTEKRPLGVPTHRA